MISPIHPNKIPVTENIVDRDQLQAAYINRVLDDMDIKDMMAILYDQMDVEFDKYTVDELIEQVEEYYPDLIDDNDEDNVPDESTGWNQNYPLISYTKPPKVSLMKLNNSSVIFLLSGSVIMASFLIPVTLPNQSGDFTTQKPERTFPPLIVKQQAKRLTLHRRAIILQ